MPKGQPVSGKISWDESKERRLLLIMIAFCNPGNLNWASIAEAFGDGLTSSAASQKYGKIKKRDAELFQLAGGAASTTPRGKRATSAVTPKSTGKRGRQPAPTADLDDDEEEMDTPVKKLKIAKKDEGSDTDFFKRENDDEDEGLESDLGV